MIQEADAMRSVAEMADTIVNDYDVVDLLTVLADQCVKPVRHFRSRGDADLSRGQPGADRVL